VEARVWPALQRILDAAQVDESLVLVAHNSVIWVVLGCVLGLTLDRSFDFDLDFGSVSCVELHADGARVKLLNWTPGAPG